MTMAELPMIKIAADTESGWMLINESDFNAEEHDLFELDSPAPGAMAGGADLEDMTLTQLRKLASDRDIQGRSSMTQDELLAALR
jgi:hypothetical protein